MGWLKLELASSAMLGNSVRHENAVLIMLSSCWIMRCRVAWRYIWLDARDQTTVQINWCRFALNTDEYTNGYMRAQSTIPHAAYAYADGCVRMLRRARLNEPAYLLKQNYISINN